MQGTGVSPGAQAARPRQWGGPLSLPALRAAGRRRPAAPEPPRAWPRAPPAMATARQPASLMRRWGGEGGKSSLRCNRCLHSYSSPALEFPEHHVPLCLPPSTPPPRMALAGAIGRPVPQRQPLVRPGSRPEPVHGRQYQRRHPGHRLCQCQWRRGGAGRRGRHCPVSGLTNAARRSP